MHLVAITSGKGGTGKSCVAAYTGIALSEANKRTLLVELGGTSRSLDIIVAAQETAAFDIADVFAGRCRVGKAIVPAAYTDNLFLLPAPLERIQPDTGGQLPSLLSQLSREYDYVLVDGIDFAQASPSLFETILMVTTPDTLSVRACQQHARELCGQGAEKNIRLVINNVPSQVIPIHGAADFDDVIDTIGAQLIAVIPQSPKLAYSANNSRMLDEESITIRVFENLAARLRGLPRPLLIR